MRKMLLLAATLGACALIPASASADGHDWGLRHVASSLGVKIIVHDAPKVVQYRHHPRRHLRPQPWYRHFNHHAPRWTIMRRDGAGTSHRVPDRGISIGPGAITTGGPADRVGTADRRSAITPRGGGLSGTIGTMIGVAPTSQTRSRGRKSRSRS